MLQRTLVLGLLLLWTGLAPALARAEIKVTELSVADRDFMTAQRALVVELAEVNLGRSLSGKRERDLDTLQTLLDRRLVRPDQTRELQAMGIVLGDLLAAELDLHWVVYTDAVGRSRALRYAETDNFLFPVTMISRRQEAGSDTPVSSIYAKARASMVAVIPALPFQ